MNEDSVTRKNDFTRGAILVPLLKFVSPVFFALLLQSLYGAVDLLIVGRFSHASEVAAVSTGAQSMMALMTLVGAFAMSVTIILGQTLGRNELSKIPIIIGAALAFFGVAGSFLSLFIPTIAPLMIDIMQTPSEARESAIAYLSVCGFGAITVLAYNLFGSVFRGLGDSKTPLIAVTIAAFSNVLGDLLLVAYYGMGAKGAAIATVSAQAMSVLISYALARRRSALGEVRLKHIRFNKRIIKQIFSLGAPIALQDMLVNISFLVLLGIINHIGLTAAAGGGVSARICGFIMLVPASFMHAMAAFVAQNVGAMEYARAQKALVYGISVSSCVGVLMFFLAFFHGNLLAGLFTEEEAVVLAAADYLRAYAIDCLMTCFLFCFIGYFNGMGMTRFVMMQGLIGSFGVRIPVSLYVSQQDWATLFHIGLATPCSTAIQIVLCLLAFHWAKRKNSEKA